MTAINALALGNRAWLLTDTAAYGPDGIVARFVCKVVALPLAGAALAVRGACEARDIATEALSGCTTFDTLVADGAEALEDAYRSGAFDLSDEGEQEFDLILVGYSAERRRCEAYFLSSLTHADAEAFRFHRRDLVLAPWPTPEALEGAGVTAGGQFQLADPVDALLRAAELQRRTPGPTGSAHPDRLAHVVGGQALLTEVTEGRIVQRVVRSWSDRIGAPITPSPFLEPTALPPRGRKFSASPAPRPPCQGLRCGLSGLTGGMMLGNMLPIPGGALIGAALGAVIGGGAGPAGHPSSSKRKRDHERRQRFRVFAAGLHADGHHALPG